MSKSESIYFLDTFSTDERSSGYREFDDLPFDDYSLTGGWLRIEAGVKQDLLDGGSKKGAPLLLRPAPEGDYWVETFVSAPRIKEKEPSQPININTQMGLFVFQDVKNWLFFGLTNHNFTFDGIPHVGDGLMVTKTEGGTFSPMPIEGAADPAYPTHPLKQDALYLRISREGDDWKFYWKLHHDDLWDLLTTVNLALGDHEVGMGVKTFDIHPAGKEYEGQADFDFFLIGRGPTRRNGVAFQYVVKFVCGKSAGDVMARGRYFTAINVHNPTDRTIVFKKKFAIALPGETPGPVSRVFRAKLGPDEALEIDCPDIHKHARTTAGCFLKGFAVIESGVELDVVAVYTAAGKTKRVETLHMERVPPRRVKVELPDLVPLPDPQVGFCNQVQEGPDKGKLLVTVKNQGNAKAPKSTTRVTFDTSGGDVVVDLDTPELDVGAPADLEPLDIPSRCYQEGECHFTIEVNANNEIVESDYSNNFASGTCIR